VTAVAGASGWPLVLAGPLVRRVEPAGASVFVACKHARAVQLSIYAGTSPDPRHLVHTEEGRTIPLGRYLHVALVTARPAEPLEPGRLYGYDLRFAEPGNAEPAGNAGSVGNADPGSAGTDRTAGTADLRSLGLLDRLKYAPGLLPGFVVPPDRLDQVRVLHGSCRKPQAERRDALATLDQILEATHGDPHRRPQQLFLTGDQVYADDVHPVVLGLAAHVGRAALGWADPEALPDVPDDFLLAPTRRQALMQRQAGFSGPIMHSHLVSLAEFYGMYLLAWSDELWPRDRGGNLCLPPPEAVLDDPRWRERSRRKARAKAVFLATRHRADLVEYVRTVPRVRRALANVATYMIFDDHEVTDDWNLHRQWREKVLRRPLGRRVLQNALASYAVFQAWGNDPAQFGPGRPGADLLAALRSWDGTVGRTADTVAARVGLPSPVQAAPLRWDYTVDTPAYQVIVLDTRTRRGFEPGGRGRAAPALLSEQARREQLEDRLEARDREVPLTLVVSPAPVFGHPFIEAWVQLKKIKAIEWSERLTAKVDREAWSLDRTAFETLLATLSRFDRVVILSGDVHYGFAGSVEYWDRRDGTERYAHFVQCTSSPLKGEDGKTRLLGGVPTVTRVPAVLGARMERFLANLSSPPPMAFLGWSADPRPPRFPRVPRPPRVGPLRRTEPAAGRRAPTVLPASFAAARVLRAEPEWGYSVDFHADSGGEPLARGRTDAEYRRAVALRAEHGWSLMHCIVGRNNLADVEFLPVAERGPGQTAYLVRQSLWFEKSSIRSRSGPERLPYTVYDLVLDLYGRSPGRPQGRLSGRLQARLSARSQGRSRGR
jgi:hypothetical protein